MNYIPISQPTLPSLDKIEPHLKKIFKTCQLTNGEFVGKLERMVSGYLGVKEVVAVSSATSGLILTMQALKLKGQAIIPSFTFPATAHAAVWNGLEIVFADCDPCTFNLDPDDVKRKINSRTSCIIPVHVFGNPVDMPQILRMARAKGLKVVVDGAHALGSCINGRSVASYADATVFSLAPSKLVTSGEGGLIALNDRKLAATLRLARNYGNPPDYNCRFCGLNARMSEFHAVLAIESFKGLDRYIRQRNRMADIYRKRLSRIPGITFQDVKKKDLSTYNYFATVIDEKIFGMGAGQLKELLWKKGIQTKRYFYPTVHTQMAYSRHNRLKGLEKSVSLSDRALCLPLYTHMKLDTISRICDIIAGIKPMKKGGKA